MRPTKNERLKRDAETASMAKSKEEREELLAQAVARCDLDFGPPYLWQEEAILKDYFPRRYPNLLKLFPAWECLPEHQRMNAVFIVKYKLTPKLSLKDGPAIQRQITKVLEGKRTSSGDSIDEAFCKFKR